MDGQNNHGEIPPGYQRLLQKYMTDSTPLPIEMEVSAAWMLVSALQLVCRHPGISPMMRTQFEHIGRLFQDAITGYDTEAWALLEKGWHEQYDVPRDDADGNEV